MDVKFGNGPTDCGPGVQIDLTGDEVAQAIHAYLVAHGVHISGPSTVTVNGGFCIKGGVYVDPSGFVISEGVKYLGSGFDHK